MMCHRGSSPSPPLPAPHVLNDLLDELGLDRAEEGVLHRPHRSTDQISTTGSCEAMSHPGGPLRTSTSRKSLPTSGSNPTNSASPGESDDPRPGSSSSLMWKRPQAWHHRLPRPGGPGPRPTRPTSPYSEAQSRRNSGDSELAIGRRRRSTTPTRSDATTPPSWSAQHKPAWGSTSPTFDGPSTSPSHHRLRPSLRKQGAPAETEQAATASSSHRTTPGSITPRSTARRSPRPTSPRMTC